MSIRTPTPRTESAASSVTTISGADLGALSLSFESQTQSTQGDADKVNWLNATKNTVEIIDFSNKMTLGSGLITSS